MNNIVRIRRNRWLFAATIALIAIPEAKAQPPRAREPTGLITRLPSAIAMRTNLFGAENEPACRVFTVRLLGSALPATLATNGLDGAQVAPARSESCPASGWGPELRLRPGGDAQLVALLITPSRGPAERTGQIIIYSEAGQLGSAALKVQRAELVPLWTEVKWAVGFVLPAMIAFLFGLWVAARNERMRARAQLVTFRTEKKAAVDQLVAEVRTALTGKLKQPGLQILQSLQGAGAIPQLPLGDQEGIIRDCERNRLWRLVRRLRRLFPLHGEQLKQAAADGKLRFWRFV